MKTSLPAKLNSLKPGESMVLFGDYPSVMRQIAGLIKKGYASKEIKYKKAQIIVAEKLHIGTCVINTAKCVKRGKNAKKKKKYKI